MRARLPSLRRLTPLFAGLAALALVAGARLLLPDPFERLSAYAFDSLQRLSPAAGAAGPRASEVVVVDIDEASLARYGQWPWPRARVADLVARLQDAGARAIGLDIVFAEPDRASPSALAADWKAAFGLDLATGGRALPDFDRDFAGVIARGRVVTGFGLLPTPDSRRPVLGSGIGVIGGDAAGLVPGFRGAVPNLPDFDRAAAGQGSFTIAAAGRDEVIRRLPVIMTLDGTLVPALSLEVVRVAAGDDAEVRLRAERAGDGRGPITGWLARIGDIDVPLGPDGSLWLRHGPHPAERTLSAAQVLAPEAIETLRRVVEGRAVLIGTSAVGLSDLRPTPLNPFEPGVNLHARAIEQMLGGRFLVRPATAPGAEILAALVLSLLAALLVTACGVRYGVAAALTAGGGAIFGAALAFDRAGLLLDPTLLVLAPLATAAAAALARHFVAERAAHALRTAFRQYLSPQLVEDLARDPGRLRLGGEEREMTFLFTDLEGFTQYAELVSPERLVRSLNAYLDGLCRIAMDHGGTVDKIVGDAVHVMFNAPLEQPDHAARAVRCALAIDAFACRFAAEAEAAEPSGVPFGRTRIGINTGRAVIGNFGGAQRFDYTAHGDAINTAARLEAANKTLGTRICIARSTVEAAGAAPDLAFRPIAELSLKGKSRTVEVYVPLAHGESASSWAERYGDAFARLSRGEETGARDILALHALHPDDPLLAFHAARIAAGQRSTAVGGAAA